MNLYDKACQFAKQVLCDFGDAETATIQDIEEADGRRGQNPISERGSYVYAAYDAEECLLYVGETGESIKIRFTSDGSGSHRERPWYDDVKTVRYKKLNPTCKRYRTLLEKALILAGDQKYNER